MTGSVCDSAAEAAHRENWQNDLTRARIKSRKTKNTSQGAPKEKPHRQVAGSKKNKFIKISLAGGALGLNMLGSLGLPGNLLAEGQSGNKNIEETIFYVCNDHTPT